MLKKWPNQWNALALALLVIADVATATSDSFSLSQNCPPYFRKNAEGSCDYDGNYARQAYQNLAIRNLQERLPTKLNPAEIDLGRYLFFDPILSRDGNMSCASCHQPQRALSDGLSQALGRGGKVLPRSTPSLWNVSLKKFLFWDGRAMSLQDQLLGPLFSPDEMASDKSLVESRLNANKHYRRLFAQAFGRSKIVFENVVQALVTFERSLIAFNSRFDRYFLGDETALNASEIEGHNIYRSFVTRCAECHVPPLFTNDAAVVTGAPDGKNAGPDVGIGAWSKNKLHESAFRVPSIRNIAETAPYMHSGGLDTLEEVVHFYNLGGGKGIPEKSKLRIHWHVRKMDISIDEEQKLVQFLKTLSEQSFPSIEVPSVLPSGLKSSTFIKD